MSKISSYRRRYWDLSLAFKGEGPLCYCIDIEELFQTLGVVHMVDKWRLFIDSSQTSLKAVLLHVGNKKPPSKLHTLFSKKNLKTIIKSC